MNSFFVLRRLGAAACVAGPLMIVVACSQPASHPAVIGDCTGPNCVSGGGASGSGTGSGGGDGSTASDDSSTGGDSGTVDDSGSVTTGD